MTREEAIYYLQSSGFSEEQIRTIEQAFTCEDAISRQAVLDITWEEPSYIDPLNVLTEIRDKFKDLPPVNPQPKTGHWINVNEGKWNTIPAYKCSVCGANANLRDWSGESPFCPWCGAKMVEPQETETWNGIHAQITAPKGTFERIFNDADDENDI